jgi:nucleoside-diphosphate-sugar epimerase
VLVTGGAGFLGSELVRRLRERGERVRLLLRRAAEPPDPKAVYGSLGDPEAVDRAVAGTEIVYHAGAAMRGGAAEFEQGTVWGTRNIIDSCLRQGVKKLIYVSSMSVFDHAGHPDGAPVKEDWRYEPYPERRGAYTRTKLEAERMVLDAIRDRGLPAVILRPGQIFGPGAERVAPNGVIGFGGLWIVAGGGGRALPLVYRDDVVDALLLAAENDEAAGRILNIVDTTTIDQNEYLRRCAPKLGGIRVVRAPVWLLTAAAAMAEALAGALGRGSPLTPYRIRSLKPLSPFDTTLAGRILGWRPAVGVAEGLKRTFGAP